LIVLDENILASQRQSLEMSGFSPKQVGVDFGRKGMTDDEIVTLLWSYRDVTFFSRDGDFYRRRQRHPRCCLVVAAVEQDEVASFVRRFLRHPEFDTRARRAGSVVRVSQSGLSVLRVRHSAETRVVWASP
jgi:hypothetical protein